MAVLLVHVAVNFAPDVLAATRIDFLGQGLTFFFCLSGFLLYMPYITRLSARREMPAIRPYLRLRVMRIFPVYLVIFMITNFVMRAVYLENAFTAGWSSKGTGKGMMTDPLHLLANLTLTQSLFPSTLQTGINPSWSLTTEWIFYLALPLIGLALAVGAKRSRRPLLAAIWPPAAFLVMGVAVYSVVGILQVKYFPHNILEAYWGPNWIAVLSRSFFALSDCFAFGMCAAVIYIALANGALENVSTFRLQLISGVTMLLGLVASLLTFWLLPHYLQTVFGFTSAALILLITIPAARNEYSIVASITDWAPIRYLGMISLSIYLWHYPIIIVVERLELPIPTHVGGLAIAFVLIASITVGLASITYRFIERPALTHRG